MGRTPTVGAYADSDTKVPRYQSSVTAAQPVTDTSTANPAQHQQHLNSELSASASDSRYLALLYERAEQKVKHLWSPNAGDPDSGKDDLLDAVDRSSQLPQRSEQRGNASVHQVSSHASAPGVGTDPSDLLLVMREAEELGFAASVFSSDMPPAATEQLNLAADATSQTGTSPTCIAWHCTSPKLNPLSPAPFTLATSLPQLFWRLKITTI